MVGAPGGDTVLIPAVSPDSTVQTDDWIVSPSAVRIGVQSIRYWVLSAGSFPTGISVGPSSFAVVVFTLPCTPKRGVPCSQNIASSSPMSKIVTA